MQVKQSQLRLRFQTMCIQTDILLDYCSCGWSQISVDMYGTEVYIYSFKHAGIQECQKYSCIISSNTSQQMFQGSFISRVSGYLIQLIWLTYHLKLEDLQLSRNVIDLLLWNTVCQLLRQQLTGVKAVNPFVCCQLQSIRACQQVQV